MIRQLGVRTADNGFIVSWIDVDSHGEEFHDEKIFLVRSEAEQFVIDLMRQMRI